MTTTVIPAPTLADQPIEQVAVNTIRTLCMDAVQAANSGHPGTPMAMAPVTYTLWQQFLRFDPAAPIWSQPGPVRAVRRPRLHPAVLDAAPDRRQVGQPAVRGARRAGRATGRPAQVPAAGLQVPRPPRVPVDRGRRMHHRPAGHRHRHQRRHGHRRSVAGRNLQPARVRPVRLRRLRPGRGRLPDGRHRRRGRLAGRASAAGEPVLDLRQQQDHHRGRHRPRVHRGRRRPVHRLRLGGPPRRPTPTTWTRCPPRSTRSRPNRTSPP